MTAKKRYHTILALALATAEFSFYTGPQSIYSAKQQGTNSSKEDKKVKTEKEDNVNKHRQEAKKVHVSISSMKK